MTTVQQPVSLLGSGTQATWQQEQQASKNALDAEISSLHKRDMLYHSMPSDPLKQTLPVTTQGFSQGGVPPYAAGEQPIWLGEKSFGLQQPPSLGQPSAGVWMQPLPSSGGMVQQSSGGLALQQQQSFGQSGVIPLKPICIEQEAVTFRPQPITIQQPPLTVQPDMITIPQPPIVIHPEPIVIPQAPLVFQPPAVSLARQAVTFQPDAITLARPSYMVQPLIQYDMRGSARFGERDLKQCVFIRLTNDQIMRQQMGENWRGNQFVTQSTPLSPRNVQFQQLGGAPLYAKPANFPQKTGENTFATTTYSSTSTANPYYRA